ncbi:MAG: lysophospholipid acyltransferase family protein [Candidatus Caenarcaniphilales bacterium]|nr:lysophospholipid acyltransferase family protein [Candidatus Caenarcaniphilales bacterium]
MSAYPQIAILVRWVLYWLSKLILRFWIGVKVKGCEKLKLPSENQFVLIANHNSHLDTAALLTLFPFQELKLIKPVAAADYFMGSAFMRWFSSTVLNILPIERIEVSRSNNPIAQMSEALEGGYSLILFPEGSRGNPEELASLQPGIAHLIRRFPSIIYQIVFMHGLGRSLPKGERVILPFFAELIISEPIHFEGTKAEILSKLDATMILLASQCHYPVNPD